MSSFEHVYLILEYNFKQLDRGVCLCLLHYYVYPTESEGAFMLTQYICKHVHRSQNSDHNFLLFILIPKTCIQ